MMSDRELTRQYGTIGGEERFRLLLEARARADAREVERLADTCARRSFSLPDPACFDRVDASWDLAVGVALEISPRLAQLRMLEATPELATRAVLTGVHAMNVAMAPSEGAELLDDAELSAAVGEPFQDMVGTVTAEIRADIAAVFEAFARVCRGEMGLEPDVVLGAHHVVPYAAEVMEVLADAGPDEAQIGAWRELFLRVWRERVQPGR